MRLSSSIMVRENLNGMSREVLLPWATARPDRFTIRRSQVGRGAQAYTEEEKEFPITGMGLHWEADAVARDIRGSSPHCESRLFVPR